MLIGLGVLAEVRTYPTPPAQRAPALRQHGKPGACRVLVSDRVKAVIRSDSIWLGAKPTTARAWQHPPLRVAQRLGAERRDPDRMEVDRQELARTMVVFVLRVD